MSNVTLIGRRDFLRAGGIGAGLLIGFLLPESSKLAAQGRRPEVAAKPQAYIHIAPDNKVTFFITKAEMGQGTVTSLSMLLAEELGCDWKNVHTEFAPVDPALYGMQGVVGSASIRTLWLPLRQAGATARAMLIEAAAQQWNVDAASLRAENGFVIGSKQASYGSLSQAAAALPLPTNVKVKDAATFTLIGKSLKRLDTPDKVNGKAQFGIDARVPGMVYASIVRCPVFGGKVASFDAAKAKAFPGVTSVLQVSTGIAVVGVNTWAAMQGAKALQVQWDEGPNAAQSTAGISKMFRELAKEPGAIAKSTGDTEKGFAAAAKKLDAEYDAPYLSHAPMEPLNCTAVVNADSCEIWASTQMQSGSRDTAAKTAGLQRDQVKVNTLYMGGGFGRRARVDYVAETVEIAKAMPGVPVKLTWSREDDMRHDFYRPASYVKFSGAVDTEGWPSVFTARVACPSFAGGRGGGGVDGTAVEGLHNTEYQFPNLLVDYHRAEAGIPTSYWRAVGYTQNTFFAESFLDELAFAGGKDPLAVRKRLLANSPRQLKVLTVAAEQAGWGKAPAGRFHGLAVVNNIGSFTAQVAEVSVVNGKLKVHRVVCAVDCGHVVNPAILTQQIEGGIVYGLSAALKGAITIDRGRVQQGNFDTYNVVRIDEMPIVEVHVVQTDNAPGGIGEASVPPIAPAVCNAIFAATGKRIRQLPIRQQDLA